MRSGSRALRAFRPRKEYKRKPSKHYTLRNFLRNGKHIRRSIGIGRICACIHRKNEAGALADALGVIGKAGFNMRTLRSRPRKELIWNYYFYLEAEGALRSEAGEKMLSELRMYCDRLKVVGIYR